MQHVSMSDTKITMNGRQICLPLEMVLDGLVDMIDQARILSMDENCGGK